MRIKRIEILGFKSFCDRTVLNFSEPITAVVGPNGCGKSNIVDAIRWCMGEQSAKHLRGQAMGDVIFAGSDTRGPAGMAEVSLTFEDVGFSAETLRLALEDESTLTDPILGDESESETGPESASGSEAESASGSETESASGSETESVAASGSETVAASETDAEAAKPEAPPDIDVHAATREVQDVLAETPPAIDFGQYSEVTITRRLFRDGTSGYFLNRTPCRLRDITDFFLGTGVGTKAYSIIEQGRIGQIVSSRPQDRRHIIEEAAGITKFKTKKRAAERKLDQTRQNLLRVSDIVTELDKRLGSLRRQAQKAERYRRYKDEMRDIELWMASHRWLEIQAAEKTHSAELDLLTSEHEAIRAEHDARDGKLVAERAELATEERRLSGLQEQIYDLDNRIQLSDSKIAYQRKEASELEERSQAESGEIRSLSERKVELQQEAERRVSELEVLSSEVEERSSEVTSRESETQEVRDELAAAQRQLEEARNLLAQSRADMARADSQKQALERRRDDTQRRLGQVTDETATLHTRQVELEQGIKRLDEGLSDLRQTRMDLGVRAEELESRRGHLQESLDSSEAEVETMRTELHRRRSRLQSLREIHDRYEGFQRGTRAVMQSQGSLGDVAGGLRGLVADYLQAPEQLEVAVEAALGDRLGSVLVDSQVTGAKAVQYLKESSSGRSAFVPYAADSGQAMYEDRSGWATAQEGVLGPMVDLVSFEQGMERLGPTLLGNTLVVENLERAITMYESGVRQPMVTLDGDLVDERGVVAGGSRDSQGSGVLAQKREIRELEEICESLERDLANATARYVQFKNELSQVQKALEGLRQESHGGDLAITVGEKDLSASHNELERVRERTARLNSEQLDLEERLRGIERDEVAMRELEERAKEGLDVHERSQLGFAAEATELQVKFEGLSSGLTEARVALAQLGEKRASADAAALRVRAQVGELEQRIAQLEASIADGSTRAMTLRSEADALETELVELRASRVELGNTMREGRDDYERRQTEITGEEIEVRQLRQKTEELAGKVSSIETLLARLSGDREHLEETIDERHRLRLDRVVGDYHLRPQAGEVEDERLSQLKGFIDRMGADINLTAIEEYEELNVRHGFLSAQRDDLDNAVGQLERAINKINRTSRRLFRETFDAINAEFQDTFPKLFRGGRAKLALTGADDDILEAGVEIHAQPPGKKNTTVDQLSGGEKALTAVALLFAIFLIKPSPFCLLDEVDAPLDEANVDRYNETLRLMTQRSQFIVITHNKRTMEVADHLYGVTMQEPGVSKLVAVNLSKLDELGASQAA